MWALGVFLELFFVLRQLGRQYTFHRAAGLCPSISFGAESVLGKEECAAVESLPEIPPPKGLLPQWGVLDLEPLQPNEHMNDTISTEEQQLEQPTDHNDAQPVAWPVALLNGSSVDPSEGVSLQALLNSSADDASEGIRGLPAALSSVTMERWGSPTSWRISAAMAVPLAIALVFLLLGSATVFALRARKQRARSRHHGAWGGASRLLAGDVSTPAAVAYPGLHTNNAWQSSEPKEESVWVRRSRGSWGGGTNELLHSPAAAAQLDISASDQQCDGSWSPSGGRVLRLRWEPPEPPFAGPYASEAKAAKTPLTTRKGRRQDSEMEGERGAGPASAVRSSARKPRNRG